MTREIALSQGMLALVDEVDFEYLRQFKWCVSRYGQTSYALRHKGPLAQQVTIFMHRAIAERMGLDIAGKEVDHISTDGLDNRRSNLRAATKAENQHNQGRNRTNRSGYKGVCWVTSRRKWLACIKVGGKSRFLGHFKTAEQAAQAYDTAARSFFGEFARTNVSPGKKGLSTGRIP